MLNTMIKPHHINLIDDAFTYPESDRAKVLVSMAEEYYEFYGLEMPDEIWDNGELKDLIYPEDKSNAKVALEKLAHHAYQYHNQNANRVMIDNNVTINTLIKFIKRTSFGTLVQNMGINNNTLKNLRNRFITRPALNLVIEVFENKRNRAQLENYFSEMAIDSIPNYLRKL